MSVWCVFMRRAWGGERTLLRIFADEDDADRYARRVAADLGSEWAVYPVMWQVE